MREELVMAARCHACEDLLSPHPYGDESLPADCAVCELPVLCEDCAIKLGGICPPCKQAMEAR